MLAITVIILNITISISLMVSEEANDVKDNT